MKLKLKNSKLSSDEELLAIEEKYLKGVAGRSLLAAGGKVKNKMLK